RQRSIELDESLIERFIRRKLGTRNTRDVTRADVAKLHKELRDTPRQANMVVALFSKMMNLAEQWGVRPDNSNPCRHVRKYPENKRNRYLSADELATLGETIAEDPRIRHSLPSALTAIRLLILTGCRRLEILTLRWEHVDLPGRCLRLPESKTGAKVVHLNAPALEILSDLERDPSGWVVPGHNQGSRLINIQKPWDRLSAHATVKLWATSIDPHISGLVAKLRRELKREPTAKECQKAAAAIGIALPPHLLDARIHDLRHSFASVAVAGGLSLPIIGALLGHTQPQTTARYAHLAADPMKAVTEKIGAAIAGMMEGKTATVKPLKKR